MIETLGPGDVCGWSWLFARTAGSSTCAPSSPCASLAFDAACLRGKIERDDALGYDLMRRFAPVMLERLQATRLRLVDVYGNPAG